MVSNEKLYELLNDNKLEDLRKSLMDNIREEIAKKSTSIDVGGLKVIKSILKTVNIPSLHGFIKSKKFDNTYYFSDGFRIVKANDFLGYEAAEIQPDFDKIIDSSYDYDCHFDVNIEELKLFIKTHKKSDREPFIVDLGNDKKAGFNPRFMLEMCNFSNSNRFYYKGFNGTRFAGMVAQKDDNGDIINILLSIKVN